MTQKLEVAGLPAHTKKGKGMRRLLVIGFAFLLAACGKNIEGTYSWNPTGVPQQKMSMTFKPDGTSQMAIGGTTLPVEMPFKQTGDKLVVQGAKGLIDVTILENGDLLMEGMRLTKETTVKVAEPAAKEDSRMAAAPEPASKAPATLQVPPAAPVGISAVTPAQPTRPAAPEVPTEDPKVLVLKPSFDCSKASSFAEKTICSETLLGRLDGALGQNFGFMAASDLGDGAKQHLRTTQRQWLAERNKCTTAACLEKAYRDRIDVVCDYPVISGLHPVCTEQENVR